MIKRIRLFMTAVLLVSISAMNAQVTTASMSGKVTSNEGAVIGATVIATHEPSGSTYGAVTNFEGRFSFNGMRVGGPYNVSVTYVGYENYKAKDITLGLGDNYVLNVLLKEASTEIGEVVVLGDRTSAQNTQRMGAALNIGTREINLMPTVSRSINDITRLTPQANGNQIGGGNYRQNYITVDGAQFNNAFGIGSNLPGGGTPISIDALDQISVNITPFDVRQSGFIGAAINAVTKSGTNQFKGSAYTYLQNEKMKGNKVGDVTFDRTPAKYNMYGVTLGGPIIKNRLFFFANYEIEKNTVPGPSRVAATPENPTNYANNIARPTVAEMDMISKYLQEKYGYDPGPYQGYSNESPAQRILARLDWNISKNHKLNVRYSNQKSKSPVGPSTSTSPISFPQNTYSGNRLAMDAIYFKNAGYYQESNFSSLSSELNSQFGGGKVRNMLRFTFSHQNEPRSSDGKVFPFVDILKDNKVFTSFGTELFTYGNLRDVKTYTITDEVSWAMDIHNITAGVQYEYNQTKNGFMRFGSSYYAFSSWNDFVNGNKPLAYAVTFSNTPGYAQAFPSFNFGQYTAYIQDQIDASDRLRLTFGIRFDLPTYTQPADAHPMIAKLDFNGNKFNTATLPTSRVLASPRFGFNYDILGDRSLVLRGGTGIFTGRIPFVWIVGQVGDAGMLQTTQTFTGAATPGAFNPNPSAYYPATQPAAGTLLPQYFAVMDEKFKMPQSWKSSLGIEAKLPWGLRGSLEGIYNKDINAAFVRNFGLRGAVPMNISGYPDNRLIYPSTDAARYYQYVNLSTGLPGSGARGISPYVVGNEKGGYYYSLTAKLEKTFDKGFYAMAAYTYSDARNLVDGFGDQVSSAWNGNPNVNGANSVEQGYAGYLMPHKVIASASYRIEYLNSMASTISIFYNGSAQDRFSYVYSSNIVRDGANAVNLIYVPKDASEITFVDQTVNNKLWTAKEQSDAFFAYINQDAYLSTRKGQYAERNGVLLPWVNKFDLKFMQEFFVKVGGQRNTLQVSFDVLNVGNLINSNWGNNWRFNQNNILVPTNVNNIVPGGTVKPTYRLNPYNNEMLKETFSKNIGYPSTYSFQLGIKYLFN